MEVEVLGHVSLSAGGKRVTPSAAKTKQVLTLLLVNANHLVTVPTLIEELWDERPPATALSTLQTYVFQLRRLLAHLLPEECPKDILTTTPNGYAIHVRPDALDLHRYEILVSDGRRAFSAGDHESAVEHLRAAERLFQGPALADIRPGRHLEAEIVRLEAARLSALETRIEAELALGRHHELLGELHGLASQHTQHESFHRQLMLALYRCGQRPGALNTFNRLRRRLVEDLGLEPSGELQRLQRAILAAAPELSRTGRFQLSWTP
ncbi:AfsR/SARP family transcriptional regulator [Streptomyces silaceus]|uniref:AfsR/SARP family transcriptional regulator n=1 Tax=Streptomyces silaceus TaxID=545123 RepID=UPI0006EB4DB7|nr:AfsR/SARP family transcriptional regulator [Streptomyces silaceus]